MTASYLQLEPDEQIVFVRYRHIINLLPIAISTGIVLLVLPVIGVIVAGHSGSLPLPISAATINFVLMIAAVLTVATFFFALYIFLQNRIILTNKHYLQIDQIGLFNRSVNKLHLEQIQDVRGTRKGVFATLLNYGEIEVETAGEQENFVFKPIADALDVAEAINECRQRYIKDHPDRGRTGV